MRRGLASAAIALAVLGSCRSAPRETVKPDPFAGRCDARGLAWLVGKPRTAIPVAIDPSRWRVSCVTCPPATDVRPERSNILFDAKTGVVVSVTCG
jgi:hypothetical protein